MAAHFVSNDLLQGAVADCECIDWLAAQLDEERCARARSAEGYSSVIFARPLCTLLACCVPLDAALQCWRAMLHAANPRIFFLRLLCAFLLRACDAACGDLGELMEALERSFRGTYDAKDVLEAARESMELIPDGLVQKQLRIIEEQLTVRAQASLEQRQKARRARERCLRQLLLEDLSLRQALLQQMQRLWLAERRREVMQMDFLELLATEGLRTSAWEAEHRMT